MILKSMFDRSSSDDLPRVTAKYVIPGTIIGVVWQAVLFYTAKRTRLSLIWDEGLLSHPFIEYLYLILTGIMLSITEVSCGNVSITHQGGDEIEMDLLSTKPYPDGSSSSLSMQHSDETPTPDTKGHNRAKFMHGDTILVNGSSGKKLHLCGQTPRVASILY
jgi:hypothetical protein